MPTKKSSAKQLLTEQLKQTRTEQLRQIQEAIVGLEARIKEYENKSKQVALLDSVSLGLYEEIDKLARKAPAEPLTDLALSQVNDVIRETKELLIEDAYIQRLNQFVAAGDNPQHRDAVVVLRQIRQGLERSYEYFNGVTELLRTRQRDARAIAVAIELNQEDGEDVTQKELKANGVSISQDWLIRQNYEDFFSFTRLDRTDIREFFAEVT